MAERRRRAQDALRHPRRARGSVVKVVYAILAVLMGLSLFLVVGPLNIGELFRRQRRQPTPPSRSKNRPNGSKPKLKKEPGRPRPAAVA